MGQTRNTNEVIREELASLANAPRVSNAGAECVGRILQTTNFTAILEATHTSKLRTRMEGTVDRFIGGLTRLPPQDKGAITGLIDTHASYLRNALDAALDKDAIGDSDVI